MRKPCEYCGADLPEGGDRSTRRQRSHHFTVCPNRPAPIPTYSHEAALERAREALKDITTSEDLEYIWGVAKTTLDTL